MKQLARLETLFIFLTPKFLQGGEEKGLEGTKEARKEKEDWRMNDSSFGT